MNTKNKVKGIQDKMSVRILYYVMGIAPAIFLYAGLMNPNTSVSGLVLNPVSKAIFYIIFGLLSAMFVSMSIAEAFLIEKAIMGGYKISVALFITNIISKILIVIKLFTGDLSRITFINSNAWYDVGYFIVYLNFMGPFIKMFLPDGFTIYHKVLDFIMPVLMAIIAILMLVFL